MYATAADLLLAVGPAELAQVATPTDLAVVDAALMRLTVEAGDRSAYTQAQIDAADAALASITDALTRAEKIIDGHIRKRYTLPLSGDFSEILGVYTIDIARYRLHDDLDSKESAIAARYRDALKFLEGVKAGDISLGADDPDEVTNEMRVDAGSKVFGRDRRPF